MAAVAEVVGARVGSESIGQAYVFRMRSGCFAVLPKHVIELSAGELSNVLLVGRAGREGQGVNPVVPDASLDLVFVNVIGALADPCGQAMNLGADDLSSIIPYVSAVGLQFMARGEFAEMKVGIARDSEVMLVVIPQSAAERVVRTMSGGTIMDERGRPLGMIVRSDVHENRALAIRFDVIRRHAYATLDRKDAGSPIAIAALRPAITTWTGNSMDASTGPAAVMTGGSWVALPVGRIVSIEFRWPQSTEFDGISVAQETLTSATQSPNRVTVWTAADDAAEWVLARSCSLSPTPQLSNQRCAFAPRLVRRVRLEFGATQATVPMAIGPVEFQSIHRH